MKKQLLFVLCIIMVISSFFLVGCPRIDVLDAFLYDGNDDTESSDDSDEVKIEVEGSDAVLFELSE